MKLRTIPTLLAFVAFSSGAVANDTMATLGAGGLVFIQTATVKMLSEDL